MGGYSGVGFNGFFLLKRKWGKKALEGGRRKEEGGKAAQWFLGMLWIA
jgi:hypothetical protein